MISCPRCNGYGTSEGSESCEECGGWGVMLSEVMDCPSCNGKVKAPMWCSDCSGKGVILIVDSFTGDVHGDGKDKVPGPVTHTVTGEDLREALTVLRVGYSDPDTLEVSSKTLGVAAVLLNLSATMGSTPFRAWIEGDEIVIEPSGIWMVRGEHACRIHEYEVKHGKV